MTKGRDTLQAERGPVNTVHSKLLLASQKKLTEDKQCPEMKLAIEAHEKMREALPILSGKNSKTLTMHSYLQALESYFTGSIWLRYFPFTSELVHWSEPYNLICKQAGINPAVSGMKPFFLDVNFLSQVSHSDNTIAIGTAALLHRELMRCDAIAQLNKDEEDREQFAYMLKSLPSLRKGVIGYALTWLQRMSIESERHATDKSLQAMGVDLRVWHVASQLLRMLSREKEILLFVEDTFIIEVAKTLGTERLQQVPPNSMEALLAHSLVCNTATIDYDHDLPSVKLMQIARSWNVNAAELAEALNCPVEASKRYVDLIDGAMMGAVGPTFNYVKDVMIYKKKLEKSLPVIAAWVPRKEFIHSLKMELRDVEEWEQKTRRLHSSLDKPFPIQRNQSGV